MSIFCLQIGNQYIADVDKLIILKRMILININLNIGINCLEAKNNYKFESPSFQFWNNGLLYGLWLNGQ